MGQAKNRGSLEERKAAATPKPYKMSAKQRNEAFDQSVMLATNELFGGLLGVQIDRRDVEMVRMATTLMMNNIP